MYIEPVSLPSAAGVSFGEGDVRHFSEGDGVNVPGLSNPTRHLAARDNLLAEKLNAVVSEVNNKEQIIPLPVYRMVIPPSSEETVANHRIPVGYEARVLNAVVSSSPTSSSIELNILWSVGFGNVSGESVLTTSDEASGGTSFYAAGEFIVQIKNKGGVTLDAVASIMVTMRPVSDITGALLPSATEAAVGPAGPTGAAGGKGDTGATGAAGSPGINWKGVWVSTPFPISYQQNDGVTHDFAGTSGVSTYRCLAPHTAAVVNQPQPALVPNGYWDFVAEAGGVGPAGATSVSFSSNLRNGDFTTRSNYIGGISNGGYLGGRSNGTVYAQPMTETRITSGAQGMAILNAAIRRVFAGGIDIVLPDTADGAAANWSNTSVSLVATTDGTHEATTYSGEYVGTGAGEFIGTGTLATSYQFTSGTNGWTVEVPGTTPRKVNIAINGATIF